MGKYSRKAPLKKGCGTCAFCSKGGLSKQHMWPDWIKKIIPREESTHSQHLIRFSRLPGKTVLIQPELKHHRGNIGARKIRNVCRTCNSGWMSWLEEKAKPILTKLILNEHIELTLADQKAVATWATLMAIIAEYTDLPTLSISEHDRQWLVNNMEPPPEWRIWLGTYSGHEWKMRYRHQGMTVARRLPFLGNRNIPCNTQSSTIVAGNMFIHLQSTSVEGVTLGFPSGRKYSIAPIWPNQERLIRCPIEPIIDDVDAKNISDDFCHGAIERGF